MVCVIAVFYCHVKMVLRVQSCIRRIKYTLIDNDLSSIYNTLTGMNRSKAITVQADREQKCITLFSVFSW